MNMHLHTFLQIPSKVYVDAPDRIRPNYLQNQTYVAQACLKGLDLETLVNR